jgi:chromosome segregation ATPase
MRAEQELSDLRQSHDELLNRLDAEQQALALAREEAKELHLRLETDTVAQTELEQLKTELDDQRAQRERVELELREQLEDAKTQRKDLETAWAEAVERNMRVEEELASLWHEQDTLNGKLKAEQLAAADSKQRADELEGRLRRNTAELTRAKADLEKQTAQLDRAESEEREQLETAKALTKKLETAWAGAVERNKRVEAELAALRQQRDQLNGQLAEARLAITETRQRAESLEYRLQQATSELDRVKSSRANTKPAAEHPPTGPAATRPRTVTRQLPTQPLRTRVQPIVRAETPPTRQTATDDLFPPSALKVERYNLKP